MRVFACVELAPREEKFVLGICYGLAATAAASDAGYSISSARLLLSKPHIQAALHDIQQNVATCLDKFERRQAKRQRAA